MLIISKVMNSQLKLSQNKNNSRWKIFGSNFTRKIGIKFSGIPVLFTNIDTGKVTKPKKRINSYLISFT
jgi:hypothetical protein